MGIQHGQSWENWQWMLLATAPNEQKEERGQTRGLASVDFEKMTEHAPNVGQSIAQLGSVFASGVCHLTDALLRIPSAFSDAH